MSDEKDPLALINAIRNRKTVDEIRELITSGIDVNTQDKRGRTALMKAVGWGEHGAGMMRLLVDAKADVNTQENIDGETALMWVVRFGGEHGAGMVRLLLDAKADVNKQNECGFTALMWVAQDGGKHCAEMMRLLLDAGADVNMQDKYGKTALTLVAHKSWGEHAAEMMRLLVDSGADANKQDKYGSTALLIAAQHGREHIELLVRLIVAHGATIPKGYIADLALVPADIIAYLNNAQNWTPLHRAADARDADAIIKCLSEGMRPDAVVESSHQDMRTALSIVESTSYPTAQPVCDRCIALLRPGLVKGGAPSNSLFGGGGGGGGGGGAHTET